MSRRQILGWVLMVLAALLLPAGLWWWALLGMTSEVGTAATGTACVVFIVGLVAALS